MIMKIKNEKISKKFNSYSLFYRSFTLIEFIIVLGIISVLLALLIVVLKPFKIIEGLRDTERINDLKKIKDSITLLETENYGYLNFYGTSSYIYISLPDTDASCSSWLNQLPTLPQSYSYRCSATPTNIDGTGWIPINFSASSLVNLQKLPIDPINKPPYFYTYVSGGSYELTAKLEKEDKEYVISTSKTRLTPITRSSSGQGNSSISFKYRRQITINNSQNSNNLTDFQISITLDTQSLISAGKMRSDCGDIRFFDSDGQTSLNYWLESGCNTNTTKIWIKVPSIPANSSKIIYIYYGNQNATSSSSGDNTFLFFDDFNGTSLDTTKWGLKKSSGGSVSISNGQITFSVSGTSDYVWIHSLNPFVYPVWQEAKVVAMPSGSPTYRQGLSTSTSIKSNGNYYNSYSIDWYSGGTPAFRIVGDSSSNGWLVTQVSSSFNANKIWQFSWISTGSQKGTDGVNSLTGTNTTNSIGNYYAFWGISSWTSGSVVLDWVRIRKYTYPEPTISIGNEESL